MRRLNSCSVMKIGISGPVSTDSIKDLLSPSGAVLPMGYKGAPFLGTLIRSLLKKGHQVSVYTLDNSLSPNNLDPVIATGENFKIYYLPMRKHSVRFNNGYLGRIVDLYHREIVAIRRSIELDNPDFVHAHWSYEFSIAAITSGKPYLMTCHDSPIQVLKYMPNIYRFGRLLMAIWALRSAKNISVVSPYLQQQLNKITSRQLCVVPNPTPVGDLNCVSDQRDNSHNLRSPKIVIVCNGWGKLKNLEPAITAFSQLLKITPDAELNIYGYDMEVDGIAHRWARENRVDRRVIFNGLVPNSLLLNALKTSTLMMHPALEECCPLGVIEAMSYGVPVVGGQDSGGVPWVLDYGISGVLVDVKSPDAILQGMLKLLEGDQYYRYIRANALERAKALFSQDSVCDAYLKIYEEILYKYRNR